jgi:hypothetical protein
MAEAIGKDAPYIRAPISARKGRAKANPMRMAL